MKTKIFAAYLPQYHQIPENDEFWGEGFTDWTAVRNATANYKWQCQPRVPLNNNYYDLSDVDVLKWQADLANTYHIDGFNIYHYWFENNHKVLEKPAENLLNHPEIDIEYFFSWDNTSWIRSWSNIVGNDWAPKFDRDPKSGKQILLKLDYGNEDDWKEHFNYLLPFFQDKRYLKICNKPVFVLMRNSDFNIINTMYNYWNKMAVENGFDGVYLITGSKAFLSKNRYDAEFMYQPRISAWGKQEAINKRILSKIPLIKQKVGFVYDYEKVWKKIIYDSKNKISKQIFYGSIVSFDDTPRRGEKARIIRNSSPILFEKYFDKLYQLCCKREKEILFLTAWNEWSEGAYLEPDQESQYAYLEAIRNVVEKYENNIK